jgi:hypothetical protein
VIGSPVVSVSCFLRLWFGVRVAVGLRGQSG